MLANGLKNNICLIILIVTVCIFIIDVGTAKASKRNLNLHAKTEESMVRQRKVEINGKYFDVYINMDKRSIIIWGEANDVEEKSKVERYFEQTNPFNSNIIYKIDIIS